ncbi:MAG: ABC transporter ATP-binding protein [Syntrophobacteraceae bacterium]
MMLTLENVSKHYQSGKVRIKVLDEVSLDIVRGEAVLLTGPSGSGKTTLLNIMGCLTRITRGRLWLQGQEISHVPDHFLSAIRRKHMGFIFQQFNLLSGLTTWENVAIPLLPVGITEKERKIRAMNLLEKLNLETRAYFLANELSGGEQQRAAIARALISDPDVILADEPLSNIDLMHVEMVILILEELKRQGKTIIVASHDSQPQLDTLVDRTIHVECGRVTLQPKPEAGAELKIPLREQENRN